MSDDRDKQSELQKQLHQVVDLIADFVTTASSTIGPKGESGEKTVDPVEPSEASIDAGPKVEAVYGAPAEAAAAPAEVPAGIEARLAALEAKIDAIHAAVEALKPTVDAETGEGDADA